MTKIVERIAALRQVMEREGLGAFIFPSTDAHNSEYVADHWKGREWISGFNGSAGTVVVTMDAAALWTDSRYFLAAEEQLRGTGIMLMKLKVEGTPTITDWLVEQLRGASHPVVGLDGWVNGTDEVQGMQAFFQGYDIQVRTDFDPLNEIWTDRPSIPTAKVELHPLEFAGETTESKFARIRESLRSCDAEAMLVSALDDIAWTLNLRGSDVYCNPVFVSYLMIEQESATLFVNEEKLDDAVRRYLSDLGVAVQPYVAVADYLRSHAIEGGLLLDSVKTCYYLASCALEKSTVTNSTIVRDSDESTGGDQSSFYGVGAAVLTTGGTISISDSTMTTDAKGGTGVFAYGDGVAMVKFLRWLQPAVEAGGQTEISLDKKLTALRSEQDLFRGISFDTIVGYEAHGAIVHYEATPETDIPVEPRGLVLIDSGAQYQDGTTDITRTIALGPVTEEQRRVYTLVLKGHIQLELAKFPDGCSGTQIDALAREPLWRAGLNYLHGTGHGVGSYLNVHEGPHQVRMEYMPAALRAGMTVTNEPGIYLSDRFGVRIENTCLIKDYMETELGRFLQMESLTLCPIDLAPVDCSLLTAEEKQWLNDYHQMVCEKLAPYLDGEDLAWLQDHCKPIDA